MIQLIMPKWSVTMPWVSVFQEIFGNDLDIRELPDYRLSPKAVIYAWCDNVAKHYINTVPRPLHTKNIVILRRYEFFSTMWNDINWENVNDLIFVNGGFKNQFERYYQGKVPVKTHLIYNPVELSKWKFKERAHGGNIAMVGYLNKKKNFPLALSILGALPPQYSLHILGGSQDAELFAYICHISYQMKRKVTIYDKIPNNMVSAWLEDKNYLLSSAISEGNPNNVNEALAKGIKPVIHNWPGAKAQYPNECVFNTLDEALAIINPQSAYESKRYRDWAKERFSVGNIQKIKELI